MHSCKPRFRLITGHYAAHHGSPGHRSISGYSVLGLAIAENDGELLVTALCAGADPDAQASATEVSAWHAAARLNRSGMIFEMSNADALSRYRRRAQLVCWGTVRKPSDSSKGCDP